MPALNLGLTTGGARGTATPTPTPTPTPAPVFTVQPSIAPSSGTIGDTFSGSDGSASNTTSFTRRWLLDGTSIGTGTTVVPIAGGSLVLEATAHGPGGDTAATSSSVTVSPTPSTITNLTVLGVTNLDPDAGGHGIDGNDWIASVTLPNDGASTFDPTKIVLTVTDPGYLSNGSATTVTRTIRGKELVRLQATASINGSTPQTGRLGGVSGGTRTVYFSLEDVVYAGSTLASASAEAGYYGDDIAGSITSLTNSSARAYPGPSSVVWLNRQYERATGSSFNAELWLSHIHARNGQQVACVEFTASDAQGTPNQSAMQRVSTPALSSICTQGYPPEVWKPGIPLANLTQGDLCKLDFTMKPWIGTAWTLSANEDTLASASPRTRLVFKNDKTGAWGGTVAYWKSGASGGAVNDRNQPFPTSAAALAAIQTANTAKGHTDLGGSTLYLRDNDGAAVNFELSANITQAGGDAWCEIKPDPLNTATVTYLQTALRTVPTRMAIVGVPVTKGNSAGVFSCNDNSVGNALMFSVDNLTCTINAGTTTPWVRQVGLLYQRNVTYPNAGGANVPALAGETTSGLRCALALGVIYTGTDITVSLVPYAVLGCSGKFSPRDPSASLQTSNDGFAMVNTFVSRQNSTFALGNVFPIVKGLCVLNCVFEQIDVATVSIGGDGMTQPMDNVQIDYITVPPDPANLSNDSGRFNHGYADVSGAVGVKKRLFKKFVLAARFATKTDMHAFGTAGSGRTGNWETGYHVGSIGNVCMYDRHASADGVDGGSGATHWFGMATGLNSQGNTGAATFTNNKANATLGGGGDYSLTGASNVAYNRVPTGRAALKYDIAGNLRLNDGTGAAGAYERP